MPTIQMPSISTAKTVLSAAASLAASAVLVRTIVNELLPRQIQDHIFSSASSFTSSFSSKLTIIVQEFHGILPNEMYKAAETYLSTKISPSTRCLQVAKQEDSKGLEVTMERGETIIDVFEGIEFKWKLICQEKEKSVLNRHRANNPFMNMTLMLETKYFVLSFHKKQKDKALTVYLPHLLQQFKNIKQEEKTIKIHTANYENMYHGMMSMDFWHGVHLDHPATFETLAMDPEQKRAVKEDLERFVRRKAYYRRVGKAWKRGYLLYGPPGTGKSSLIAAIANFLKFDIYDLELTEVRSNSTLRKLLVGTANRSILVVEDIDCTIDLQEREKKNDAAEPQSRRNEHDDKVTLSGLLNFIDGLWSSCGDERIIIFTTNHKERLDSALLRPGRMDMHIHMSYCSPSGFKTLLLNYHNVDGHPLFPEVEMLLGELQATPAEVAEELMKSDDIEFAMRSLMRFLEGKKAEASEAIKKAEASEASKKLEASEADKKEVSIQVEDSEFEEVKKSGEQDEQE